MPLKFGVSYAMFFGVFITFTQSRVYKVDHSLSGGRIFNGIGGLSGGGVSIL